MGAAPVVRCCVGRALRTVVAAWLCASSSLACAAAPTFECITDAQCVGNGADGLCQVTGYCSFPDTVCPTGQRYGEHGGSLADQCVGGGGNAGTGNAGTGIDGATDTDTAVGSGSQQTDSTSASGPGPTDTSTGATTTSVPSTATSAAGETTDTGSPDPDLNLRYVACEDPACNAGCLTVNDWELCNVECVNDDDCGSHLDPTGVLFPVSCIELFGNNRCLIPCEAPDDCPEATTCRDVIMGDACMYPPP